MGDMCNAMQSYIESTPLYRDNVKPVLLGIYQNMENSLSQMKLQNSKLRNTVISVVLTEGHSSYQT
jgi:hypothetical protein